MSSPATIKRTCAKPGCGSNRREVLNCKTVSIAFGCCDEGNVGTAISSSVDCLAKRTLPFIEYTGAPFSRTDTNAESAGAETNADADVSGVRSVTTFESKDSDRGVPSPHMFTKRTTMLSPPGGGLTRFQFSSLHPEAPTNTATTAQITTALV